MASLKDMRVRIASTKATQKITKAMQMVAAARLRRAQNAAEAARPCAVTMAPTLANITSAAVGGQDGLCDFQHRQRCRGFAGRADLARRHRSQSGSFAAGLHRRARPV